MSIAAQPVQQDLPREPLSYLANIPAGTTKDAPVSLAADGRGYVNSVAGDPTVACRIPVRSVGVRNPNVDDVFIGGQHGAYRTIPQGESVVWNVSELGAVYMANTTAGALSVEVTLLFEEVQA